MEADSNVFIQRTRKALLWMNLSHEPFVAFYALLPFILRKDLQATIIQISILSALRPVLPVFSFYWSANLTKSRLRANLIGAWALARLPFLFVPWIENIWYLIFCCAMYEFFNKSGIPALMEILKINLPKETREKTYTFYFVLSFLESIVLGLMLGRLLDLHAMSWPIICAAGALLGLSSIFLQLKVPISLDRFQPLPRQNIRRRIIQPWEEAYSLLKTNPDFARFQFGFMIGGFALMLIAPSLSIYYVDYLSLTHSNVIAGRSILMGIGIVLSSYFWKRFLIKKFVPKMTQWILVGFSLYTLVLLCATAHIGWFYFAFFLYGIAQAGSHLLWNLSGTIFSLDQDSSPFSRLNILMLGLRGAIAPALGGILCARFGPTPLLATGAVICLLGAAYVYKSARTPVFASLPD